MEEKVERVMRVLYAAYGTDSGYLFGLSPEWRYTVKAIVKAVMKQLEEKVEED